MRGGIHHLDLTVRDPDASRPFYEAVLGLMGYRLAHCHGHGFDFDADHAEGFCSVGIMRAEGAGSARRHDRYSPGLHHVAFSAQSRDDVDRLYAMLVGMGATILDPPVEYPRYGAGYYAVFITDPDGLKLEYVFQPRALA